MIECARAPTALIVGAGPSGLMAAEVLTQYGARVELRDSAASPARKFLLAGRSGLNLTHSEDKAAFLSRYGRAAACLAPALEMFSPEDLRLFCAELGEKTFVGSSGRVFPQSWKATPLLRAWLARLKARGADFRMGSRFVGFEADGAVAFSDADGALRARRADVVIFACGGGSWPRLGGGAGWVDAFRRGGFEVAPLTPANCALHFDWPVGLYEKFGGAPLKNAAFSALGQSARGEAVITRRGLEGGPIYALASRIRAALSEGVELVVDFKPDVAQCVLADRLRQKRAKDSLANALRKLARLSPSAAAMMRLSVNWPAEPSPESLAACMKAARFSVRGVADLDRAISSAGGLSLNEIDEAFMLKKRPGAFVAGEMLDWDAPTGGYLLQACFSTGYWAGVQAWRRLAAQAE